VKGLRERFESRSDWASERPPISATLGMNLVSLSAGKATMTMKTDRRFHNPMGTVHGGVMTDLADAAMGLALVSTLHPDESFTTLELKMNFLRPVLKGEMTAKAKVVHRGRRIALVESVVTSGGKPVARGVATQMILGPRRA
jgi:uncharacterized protein (TIGR00369 family)